MLEKINKRLEALLSKIGIVELFVILLLIFGSIFMGVFIISRYNSIYNVIYQERLTKLKYAVDFALEMIKDENYYVKIHKKSLKTAQEEVIGVIKDAHFSKHDYFWITDYEGKIIYHQNPNLIGKNIKHYVDSHKYNFGFHLIEVPKVKGSVYVYYYSSKPNDKTKKEYPKVSYVVAFKDWKWIVGTGVYVDDIHNKVDGVMYNGFLPIILVSLFILLIFSYIVWASIVNPIKNLAEKSLKLANNDLDVHILGGNSNTEFGKLYNAFNKFVAFFKEKRNSEEKLSLILNNITDVLINVDNKGIIKAVNPAIKDIFGYDEQDVMGMGVDLLISPPIFSEKDAFEKFKNLNGRYQMQGIKKNEELFPIEVNINKFLYDDEILFILLIRDITEEKEVEKMKNEFVSIVSHELRTPLTSIRGALGLVLSGAFSKDIKGKAKDLLEIAHNNCLRLINLINDILDIDKIAAGKMNFNNEVTDVEDIVQRIILMNKPYAEKFKVNYKLVNNLNKNALCNLDKDRFTQVMTNLLSNATKFSPEGGEVLISLEHKDGIIRISIKDNGKGIPDDFKSKIFDKFTQADSSDKRQKGGTGLGLSICKSLVEKMNGRIGFESEFGKGATFYIDFPVI